MNPEDSTTKELLDLAAAGDKSAVNRLLARHRGRLRQMVAVRMDARIATRADASDIVQETLHEAAKMLPRYLQQRSVPFYPWLRGLAWKRLIDMSRRHVAAQRRSVIREGCAGPVLSAASMVDLAELLVSSETTPSANLRRKELRAQVRGALETLSEVDRELLVLRYLEQLSTTEIAATLGVTDRTVRSRHRRAMTRMLDLLQDA